VFLCHDYPEGRQVEYQSSVSEHREHNVHVKRGTSTSDFITMRNARDLTLGMPRLILPSLQVNIRAGHFPEPEDNGRVYLKIPLNAFSMS